VGFEKPENPFSAGSACRSNPVAFACALRNIRAENIPGIDKMIGAARGMTPAADPKAAANCFPQRVIAI